MAVNPMLLNRDMEHLTGTGAVDVTTCFKDLLTPRLTGIPRDDSCFDGTEVGNIKLRTILRDEGCPDQLGEGVRDILI